MDEFEVFQSGNSKEKRKKSPFSAFLLQKRRWVSILCNWCSGVLSFNCFGYLNIVKAIVKGQRIALIFSPDICFSHVVLDFFIYFLLYFGLMLKFLSCTTKR